MTKPEPDWLRRSDIVRGLRELGVEPGDVLLTHSSLSSLGRVVGAPLPNHDSAIVFDPARTECWTGQIPATARQRPDARRSRHPTHSVCAIGPLAERLTRDHEYCETPCGWGSPYDKVQRAGGKILFIGVDLSANTMLHHVEETAGAPYVCSPEPVLAHIMEPNGWPTTVRLRVHAHGPQRDYAKLEPELMERGILRIGAIGPAPVRLVEARPMCELLRPRVAADPAYLLRDRSAYTPPQ